MRSAGIGGMLIGKAPMARKARRYQMRDACAASRTIVDSVGHVSRQRRVRTLA